MLIFLLEYLHIFLSKKFATKENFQMSRILYKKPKFAAKHFFSCKEMFNNLTGFYQSFSIDDPPMKPWRHYDFNQPITFHLIKGGYICDPMFIPIQICAGGLPSLSYLRNNNFDLVEIIDCCNGLLHCYCYNPTTFFKSYIICNPLTNEHVLLPSQAKRLTFC